MPFTPVQMLVAVLQYLLLGAGAWLLIRSLHNPSLRRRTYQRNQIAHWTVTGPEVTLLVVMILLFGMIGQGLLASLFQPAINGTPEETALQVAIYGSGFHGIALLAWPAFALVRRTLHTGYGATPPPDTPSPRLPAGRLLATAALTVIFVLPVLTLASLVWVHLLRFIGLPDAPQDLVGVFGQVESPALLLAMLVVACVVAPLNEELLFRGAIYRFCRQRFGRAVALILSGVLFGALHQNWAGFLPLALLGAGLALAYERTGDIRVPVIAHGLFNLNTILVVLSGIVPA